MRTSPTEEQLERLLEPLTSAMGRIVRLILAPLSVVLAPVLSCLRTVILRDDLPSRNGLAQRAAYQRITLAAYGAIILILGVAVVVHMRQPSRTTIKQVRQPHVIRDLFVSERVSPATQEPAPMARVNVPPPGGGLDGFLGFRNLRAVSERRRPAPVINADLYSSQKRVFASDEPVSFSPLEGVLDTVAIPAEPLWEWTDHSEPQALKPEPVSRGPMLIHRVMPEVPPSARMMEIGGYVEVLMLLNPRGNPVPYTVRAVDSVESYPECYLEVTLKDGSRAVLEFYVDSDSIRNELLYVTLVEEPTGFGFADCLHAALPEWEFAPAIHIGEPVYSFLRLGFNFCAPDDIDCQAVVLFGS